MEGCWDEVFALESEEYAEYFSKNNNNFVLEKDTNRQEMISENNKNFR